MRMLGKVLVFSFFGIGLVELFYNLQVVWGFMWFVWEILFRDSLMIDSQILFIKLQSIQQRITRPSNKLKVTKP